MREFSSSGLARRAYARDRSSRSRRSAVTRAESATDPGAYRTNDLVGEVGQRYTLTVDYQNEHYLTDPAGVKNFYLWDQLVEGVRLIAADSSFRGRVVSSDEFLDRYEILEFQPYGAVGVKSGQLVTVRQMGLSEQSYRYYTALSEQTRNGGSPFDVPLTSVRGNVANLTNPSHYAL